MVYFYNRVGEDIGIIKVYFLSSVCVFFLFYLQNSEIGILKSS